MQEYLKYCEDKGITKEVIVKKLNLDTPNIMRFKHNEQVEDSFLKNIIMAGARKNQKVALIMKENANVLDNKYIIAFNYKFDKEKER